MPYTDAEVFRDCATDKKQPIRNEERKYKEVWLAFCKWIVERFEKGKGVNIPFLMTLTWAKDEMEGEMYGDTAESVSRPAWRLADTFERAHKVQLKNKTDKRTPSDLERFAKVEEINFHKIAMRYSSTLSKDTVFSCLRDMFYAIGKAMARNKDVKIFCGVGDLCCRERKIHFEFDSHYHRYVVKHKSSEEASAAETGSADGHERLVVDDDGDESGMERATTSGGPRLPTASGRLSRTGSEDALTKEVANIYNGAPHDESWRHERIDQHVARISQVSGQLWEHTRQTLEKDADFQSKNLVLGEQRRLASEMDEEAKAAVAKRLKLTQSKLFKAEVDRLETHKKKEFEVRRSAPMEDPFYVHLEPDEGLVKKKKKETQLKLRTGLEEQIAHRLKTAGSQRSHVLHFEREIIDKSHKLLRRSLQEHTLKKAAKDELLKQEWARQIEMKNTAKAMESAVNKCLVNSMRSSSKRMIARGPSRSAATISIVTQ